MTSTDHPFATQAKIELNDLAGQKVLSIENGHHLHAQVVQLFEDIEAKPLRDYEGTNLDTLRLMVGMGVGITFLPALYVRSEIGNRGEIAVVELRTASLFRQLGMAWRQQSAHTELFTNIAQTIKDIAGQSLPEVAVID